MVSGNKPLIDSHTGLFGVFGDPVRHSRSPVMLNRAFQVTGINAVYMAFHVKPDQLEEAVRGVRALGFRGVNVTIPHKENIMRYLDEIDEGARMIGAVNTVVNRDGRLFGYNTDGIGYVRSLKEETGADLKGKSILVLGAGGAARGIVYALAQEQPRLIRIANRTRRRAENLAAAMSSLGPVEGTGTEDLETFIPDTDIVINTTSLGMHPDTESIPIVPSLLADHLLVSDLVYNPLTTRLLREAKKKGCAVHGGLGMFVYQGAYAFEYWTGQGAPVGSMREAVMESFQTPKTDSPE